MEIYNSILYNEPLYTKVPQRTPRQPMSSSPITTRPYLPTASSPSRSYDRSLSGTSSPTPLSRNPVSLRIYKVLGANFDDDATKEALTTLSDLYSSPSTSNASNGTAKPKLPTRRASAYVDSEDEDDEDESDEDVGGRRVNGNGLGGAGRLSFFEGPPPGETAAKARKNLRRDIERKLAEGSQKFLKAFGEVNEVRRPRHTHRRLPILYASSFYSSEFYVTYANALNVVPFGW